MLNLLAVRHTQSLKHLHQTLRAEQTHQIILQRDVETGFPRISLTSGTSAQLIVNTPGLVTLCTNDL